jgi:hypothetical protein
MARLWWTQPVFGQSLVPYPALLRLLDPHLASIEVTNRLDFLGALKLMIFEPEVSGKVKERAELHRILDREQRIFGERYHLMISDQRLNAVLKRHLKDDMHRLAS